MRGWQIVVVSVAGTVLAAPVCAQPHEKIPGAIGPTTTAHAAPSVRPASSPGNLRLQEQMAVGAFSRLDRDRDGLLSAEEMPPELLSERVKWDSNHDGSIDVDEYKAYFVRRIAQQREERAAAGDDWRGPPRKQGDGERPTMRADPGGENDPNRRKRLTDHHGKLPKELPAWFSELDTDRDGQVGLYEWRKSGRPLTEFAAMDRNDDGFLTAQEVLYYVANPQLQFRMSGSGDSESNRVHASRVTRPGVGGTSSPLTRNP